MHYDYHICRGGKGGGEGGYFAIIVYYLTKQCLYFQVALKICPLESMTYK